ncbi:MAG: alpha-E domain-containing protein [Coriobacteriaceae bacterium]|nr:alpha-E domain-containing protein [Coriobacteriaceae bacterium]
MGAPLAVAQASELFWLGRYIQRVMMMLDLSSEIYDLMLDGEEDYDVHSLCRRLAIPDIYEDADDFISEYLFDKDDPNSVYANLERAVDNAITLRSLISSEVISYIQLATSTMKRAAKSTSPMLEIQQVLDYLYAFWGAVEDYVPDTQTRYIMRTGRSVEAIDLSLRLRRRDEKLPGEVTRLANRLYRSKVAYDAESFQHLTECFEQGDWEYHVPELLTDVNNLVTL